MFPFQTLQRLKNTNTRTQKTLKNARVGALCYLLSLFISFFSRRIFLEHLGAEFLGFTASVGSILGFFNIAELGISSAISIVLFKPLFEQDKKQITELVSLLGFLYRLVGLFILGIGFVVSFFLPWIFPSASIPLFSLYFGYYAFLFTSLIGYFFNYQTILFSADQKNYIVTGYYQLMFSIKVIAQWLVALYSADFFLYFIFEILFAVFYALFLRFRVKQQYAWLHSRPSEGKHFLSSYPDIVAKIRQTFAHRLGGFIQLQSIPLFVLSFVSIPMVAIYGNYMLVSGSLRTLLNNVLGSTFASIGNLVAEGEQTKSLQIYWELLSFRFLCAGFFAGCFYWLVPGFISVWLGPQYLLSDIALILISLHLFLIVLRDLTDQFLLAYGLVHDVWSPIVESVLFIILSLSLGNIWGLEGLLAVPVLTMAGFIYLWKPFFLFTQGFHSSIKCYVFRFAKNMFVLIADFFLTMFLCSTIHYSNLSGWSGWLLQAACCSSVYLLVLLITFYLFIPEFRFLIRHYISHSFSHHFL